MLGIKEDGSSWDVVVGNILCLKLGMRPNHPFFCLLAVCVFIVGKKDEQG